MIVPDRYEVVLNRELVDERSHLGPLAVEPLHDAVTVITSRDELHSGLPRWRFAYPHRQDVFVV